MERPLEDHVVTCGGHRSPASCHSHLSTEGGLYGSEEIGRKGPQKKIETKTNKKNGAHANFLKVQDKSVVFPGPVS